MNGSYTKSQMRIAITAMIIQQVYAEILFLIRRILRLQNSNSNSKPQSITKILPFKSVRNLFKELMIRLALSSEALEREEEDRAKIEEIKDELLKSGKFSILGELIEEKVREKLGA